MAAEGPRSRRTARSAKRRRAAPTPGSQPASTSSSRHLSNSRDDDHGSSANDSDQNRRLAGGLNLLAINSDLFDVGDRRAPEPEHRFDMVEQCVGPDDGLVEGRDRRRLDAPAMRRRRRTIKR